MTEQEQELKRLNAFLDETLPRATSLYVDLFIGQQDSISDEELEAAVANGFDDLIRRWSAEYEEFASNRLIPMWKDALKAGASSVEQKYSIELDLDAAEIRRWLNSRARSFVETSTRNLETVIDSTLKKCRARNFTATQTAYAIRPMIGLNPRQAAANWKFQRTFVKYLSAPTTRRRRAPSKRNSISDEIEKLWDKLEGALDYSIEQVRQRAKMLAESSSVELFNKGIYELLSKGKELGIIGVCEKIWVTAEDEKVCRDCWLMSGTVAAFDEQFHDIHGNVVGLFPPLHPHCRCVIFYRMLLPPGLDDLTPEAMSTPNTPPYPLGHVDAGDSELISAVLNHYEGRISPQPIENAIVITADGEVYHTTGDLNSVDPILELGNKLLRVKS